MTGKAPNSIQITRRFAATPVQVFDAWTKPEAASKWLVTSPESESNRTELDVRAGGEWKITDRRGGKEYMGLGEYLEVDPPRKLVFTFGMPQFSPQFDKIIVELAPDGDGCVLTLTQEGMPDGYQEAARDGWGKMLDTLQAVLAGTAAGR